ncbi:MAG: glycosyltransferase family 2 protein [Candidatus Gastranaerophilales bacterium]|nr:glycosyltransferase family 2 protein [Candidatus Gastranaerophilales bacterium]
MKISVITVCYNSEKTIERTILSVINQTYSDIEYIIINGNSTDKTLDIIEKYKTKIAKVLTEDDKGIYDAMNKGNRLATGDYIIHLNSDDKLHDNDVIEKIAKFAQNNPTDIIYGDLVLKNENDKTFLKVQNHLNKLYLYKNTPCHPTIFFKKEILQKCENFDLKYKIASDFDLILKAFLKHKATYSYSNIPINIFSTGGISSSEKYLKTQDLERDEVIKTYFSKWEYVCYPFISKYFRSLSKLPVISFLFRI